MAAVKKFIRNLSLRKTLILFICASVIIALVLIGTVFALCEQEKRRISSNYHINIITGYYSDGDMIFGFEAENPSEEEVRGKLRLLEAIEVASVFLISAICIIFAVFMFYRCKLKRPLEILEMAHDKISRNDLNFIVDYAGKDEMGDLCASFEKMRVSLEKNNKAMWQAMAERKRLNAAFAHDLRTPLTVLKGYTEILQNAGDSNADTLSAMTRQIGRLERYAESMSNLQKMEDIVPDCRETDLSEFFTVLEQSARILCDAAGKRMCFTSNAGVNTAMIDTEMMLQVFENIVSNGVRYAQSVLKIDVREAAGIINITVTDDGDGFSAEALQKAAQPFYTEDASRSEHFGLGLYMCALLCRYHGGGITLKNPASGGQVTASFKTIV